MKLSKGPYFSIRRAFFLFVGLGFYSHFKSDFDKIFLVPSLPLLHLDILFSMFGFGMLAVLFFAMAFGEIVTIEDKRSRQSDQIQDV